MPRVADSRVIGILPLQHFWDSSWDEDLRASIFGVRITDRFDKGGPTQLGWWKNAERGVGDIHGGQLFQKKGSKRDVSMFRFAWPVIVQKGDKAPTGSNDVATGRAPYGSGVDEAGNPLSLASPGGGG